MKFKHSNGAFQPSYPPSVGPRTIQLAHQLRKQELARHQLDQDSEDEDEMPRTSQQGQLKF